jgi:tRNA A37 threonylcarbamoyladenosine dehydratase
MIENDEIYSRQEILKLKVPNSCLIIGVGGVGSWTAYDMASIGVKKIILVDYDIVESSNLNRTPFKISHIGKSKVEAMAELILERREDCNVVPIRDRIENVNIFVIRDVDVVIDCRDNATPLHKLLEKKCKIIGGYDGMG